MDIIELVFRKKEKARRAIEKKVTAVKTLAEEMRAPVVNCIPQPDNISQNTTESRLGGWPAWPKNTKLPVDVKGNPMVFLAQINLADAPPLEPYPERGLLQIFISSGDELYGSDFPSKNQTGFRTVFHSSTDEFEICDPYNGNLPEDMPFLDQAMCNDGHVLEFEQSSVLPSLEHYLIDECLGKWPRQLRKGGWSEMQHPELFDELYDYLQKDRGSEMYYGGHPRFSQHDIRSANRFSEYTKVLMQFGAPKGMMWGDAGEACFLITESDLRDRNFEKVIYSWDCG